MDLIETAIKEGKGGLSEFDSKKFLAEYDVEVSREALAASKEAAIKLAEEFGYPVVLKASGAAITHKTEKNLVELYLKNSDDVSRAYDALQERAGAELEGVLVQEMVQGKRELVLGMTRDAQFGPCVMFGLGGIMTEILNDVSFRVAPIKEWDAMEMMKEIRGAKILEPFRGEPAADMKKLSAFLIALGEIGLKFPQVKEIDINPVIISPRGPVAVDALVVLEKAE